MCHALSTGCEAGQDRANSGRQAMIAVPLLSPRSRRAFLVYCPKRLRNQDFGNDQVNLQDAQTFQ
jgi:hypothetical protein